MVQQTTVSLHQFAPFRISAISRVGNQPLLKEFFRRSNALRSGLHKGRVEAELWAMEEGGEFGEAKGQALWRSGPERDVTQLPAGTRGFSIQVQVRVGDGQDFGRFAKVANQIEHRAVACRSGRP